jgi:serine/threonine protein kinase
MSEGIDEGSLVRESAMSEKGLSSGDILKNRYQIKREIGRGAYGCVYLAEDKDDGLSLWAIKELREESINSDERNEIVELFKREAQVLRMLDHKHIPKVAALFALGTNHYLVMEYIEGDTLQDIMDKKHPDMKKVITWAIEICDILHYLHGLNIIFRDIKPSNVMMTKEDRVLLVDYGIARFYSRESTSDTHLLGTPGFAPPEQYGKGQSDPRSDIYALGATIYYVLTGADIATFHFKFPPISTLKPDCLDQIERILTKCLQLNPADRYQSAQELKNDLEECRNFSYPAWPAPPSSAQPQQMIAASAAKKVSPLFILITSPSVLTIIFFLALYFAAMHLLHTFYNGTEITSVTVFALRFPLVDALVRIYGYFAIALIIATIISANMTSNIANKSAISAKLVGAIPMGGWILGILLMGIFYPNIDDYRTLKCEHNLLQMGKALDSYRDAHRGMYPPELGTTLQTITKCPVAKTQSYMYRVNDTADRFTLWCAGSNHWGNPHWKRSPPYRTEPNFPQYSSSLGLIHDGASLRRGTQQ